MDGVLADEQRDSEVLVRRKILRAADLLAENMQDCARVASVNERQVVAARVPQHDLADLLLERHAAEQIVDALIHAQRGIAIRKRRGGGLRKRSGRAWQNS